METKRIYTGDYPAKLGRLAHAFDLALRDEQSDGPSTTTLAEGSASADLKQQIEALEAEAVEAGEVVEIRALGRVEWRRVAEAHPPRKVGGGVDDETAEQDKALGANADTVEEDFLCAALVTPKFTTRAAFDEWLEGDPMTPGQWTAAVTTAWGLTHGRPFDPAVLTAFRTRSTG